MRSLLHLHIRARFALQLAAAVLLMGLLGFFALQGLSDLRSAKDQLRVAVQETALDGDTRTKVQDFKGRVMLWIHAPDGYTRGRMRPEMADLAERIETNFEEMHRRYHHRPVDHALTVALQRPYERLRDVWRSRDADIDGMNRTAELKRLDLIEQLEPVAAAAGAAGMQFAVRDTELGSEAALAAQHRYQVTHDRLVRGGLLAFVLLVLVTWILFRSVVRRLRTYAAFGRDVVEGRQGGSLAVSGGDELARLGRTLQRMVDKYVAERGYDEQQAELAEALQMAGGEREAHAILHTHLERSIDHAEIVVVTRNNSADRLEARTPITPGSPLAPRLEAATPRDCIALRQAREYRREDDGRQPLLDCTICGGTPGTSSCNPLVVGGEVIGSVLVRSDEGIDGGEQERVRDSVSHAAPVLANLRTLAIAELRAATDALTGLSNTRAAQDTGKRMVAQSHRTEQPLAALALDLDHFKQINDTYGHGRGDEVLASVGAILRGELRSSDFAGRLGGEEFLVMLPNTDVEGALVAAEKLRATIAEIYVPGVDRDITASIGVGVIPDHASDYEGLLRVADRALYAAKGAGRNRVELAVPSEAGAARATA